MGLFGRRERRARVRILLRGRIGGGWFDTDRTLKIAPGTTLLQLIDLAERRGIPLREAIASSPHLRHTLMWNGERCPLDEHGQREVRDGDEIYLLAPLAGG